MKGLMATGLAGLMVIFGSAADTWSAPALTSSGQANVAATGMPTMQHIDPNRFPVRAIYRGKTAKPDFRGDNASFRTFRTRIRQGMAEGPAFAGEFSVIQFGCGAGCTGSSLRATERASSIIFQGAARTTCTSPSSTDSIAA